VAGLTDDVGRDDGGEAALLPHSITSSARARSDGGMVIPSTFAVFKLMMSLNLVGCSTGKPLR
jgi:hypothetical protein